MLIHQKAHSLHQQEAAGFRTVVNQQSAVQVRKAAQSSAELSERKRSQLRRGHQQKVLRSRRPNEAVPQTSEGGAREKTDDDPQPGKRVQIKDQRTRKSEVAAVREVTGGDRAQRQSLAIDPASAPGS